MFASSARALGLCTLLGCGLPLWAEPQLSVQTVLDWDSDLDGFGGLSGLEVSGDGRAFTAISDTGVLYQGAFSRDASGAISGAVLNTVTALVVETGQRPEEKRDRDTEGLAISETGQIHISAENWTRLLNYAAPNATPNPAPLPPFSKNTPSNKGFEALAISPHGRMLAISEGSRSIIAPFDIFLRDESGAWAPIAQMPRAGGFRPVGADFGPAGHLYILSRAFNGLTFATRIDRLVFDGERPSHFERLFSGKFGQFDNLEGLAAWRDPNGRLRLVALSDDNFSRLQRTQIVEFQLQD